MKSDIDHEDAGLRAAVRALNADSRRDLGHHPSADELLTYHEHRLPLEDEERIRNHIALCHDCAEKGLDLLGFLRPELLEEDEGSSAPAVEAEWAATRKALQREGLFGEGSTSALAASDHGQDGPGPMAVAQPEHIAEDGPPSPEIIKRTWWFVAFAPFRSLRVAYSIAALATVMLVGIMIQTNVAQDQVNVAQSQVNVQLVDLYPDGTEVQRADGFMTTMVVRSDKLLVLIFSVSASGTKSDSFVNYQVEAVDLRHPDSETAWSSDILTRSPADDFTALFPMQQLPAEQYRLRLHGIEGAQRELLEEYTLRLEPP